MTKYALAIFAALTAFSTTANAATLLVVDLSVENQISITATDGVSEATVSGTDTTGVYLANFFAMVNPVFLTSDVVINGDITTPGNISDGSPNLFNGFGTGLNLFSWAEDDQIDFIAGSIAFTGSATWSISAEDYNFFLLGPSSGDLYFPADTDDDLDDALIIGQWESITAVPLPAAVWLLGSSLLGLGVFSRKKKS